MKNIIGVTLLVLIALTSCKVEEKIKDSATAFERKQYAVAIPLLKAEYNKTRSSVEKGQLAYKLGESYRYTNQPEKAGEWYNQAYNYSYGVEALVRYAYILKQTEKYDEAIEAFKDIGSEIGDPFEYQREIVACRQARNWKKKKRNPYELQLLSFNSKDADYYPAIYENDKIVITSDRNSSTGEEIYGWTGNNYSDLFVVDPELGTVEPLSGALNSPYNEGTIAFNKDFTEAYFTRCGSDAKIAVEYCKLYYSERIGEEWSAPRVMDFIEEEINYGHPSLSDDGGTLYFSSDHPDGLGGFDIYISRKTNEGWDIPENLGAAINTEGNEISPFIDTDTLYFASDSHVGMGGFDIFKTSRKQNGGWGALENLKAPINSGADDFGLVVDYRPNKKENELLVGYFTSTREDGKGGDDIYKFAKVVLPPEVEPEPDPNTVTDNTPEIEYKMILNGVVLEKTFADPENPNSEVTGKQALAGTRVQVNVGDTTFTINPGADGTFQIVLDEQSSYDFFVSKNEYLSNNARFSTRGIERDPNNPVQTFSIEIILDKIFRNIEITLENIYYDFDSPNIRADARPALNALVNVLRQNPSINIQLAAHTDCRGNDNYNLNLSQARAQSAVDYLIKRGIDRERLQARGFGETQPAVDCACNQCTEDQHQENRRTTFTILEEE